MQGSITKPQGQKLKMEVRQVPFPKEKQVTLLGEENSRVCSEAKLENNQEGWEQPDTEIEKSGI